MVPQLILYSLITLVLYVCIGHLALSKARSLKRKRQQTGLSRVSEFDKRQFKITKTLAIILGLYFLLYVPGAILGIVISRDSPEALAIIYHFAIILFQSNACLNPFIYARGLKDFNNAFNKILKAAKETCKGGVAVDPSAD